MSQITVVAIGERTLRVVAGRSTPAGVELVRSQSAALPEDFADRDAPGRAEAIRSALAQAGGGNGRTALLLPRSVAILRDFELPGGTPEEVLQMARFQIEKEMPLPVDQTRYSYVETEGPDGRLRVAAAAVPREQVDPLVEAVESAGCKVQAAYVSSFGLASLLGGPVEGGTALVGLADGTLEVLVVEGGALALSRSVPAREAAPEAMATEVNRTLLSYGARGGGRGIKRVLVAGEGREAEALVAALKAGVAAPVEALPLPAGVTRREGVSLGLEAAAAAGVVVGALRGERMPNVLRTPSIDRKFRLKRWQQGAIAGAVLLVGLVVWSRVALADRRAEVESLRNERKKLEPRVAAVKRLEEQVKTARAWGADRYGWGDAIAAIATAVRPSDLWVYSLAGGEGSALRITGKARDDRLVNELVEKLQKDPRFETVTRESARPNGDTKSEYRYDFVVRIELRGVSKANRK